jgi:hypothetical protein
MLLLLLLLLLLRFTMGFDHLLEYPAASLLRYFLSQLCVHWKYSLEDFSERSCVGRGKAAS